MTDIPRAAFVASKKVGKAVQRNRCRRLLTEINRQHQISTKHKLDIIYVAKKRLLDVEFETASMKILKTLSRIGQN